MIYVLDDIERSGDVRRPNIKGYVSVSANVTLEEAGALINGETNGIRIGGQSLTPRHVIKLDASRWSSTYGASQTVQTASLCVLWIIKCE